MEVLDQTTLLMIAIAAIAFYVGRMSTGTPEDRARYKAWERREADENIARLSSEARAKIDVLVDRGRLIDAVKLCRGDLDLSLKEAKAVIDRLRAARR